MINVVVEGESDRELARAVVRASGHEVGIIRVAGGKTRLDPLIPKYNQAAAREPWVVFRDSDSQCPVELRNRLEETIATRNSNLCLRIAHSMSEAWLLADSVGFARYFSVPVGRISAQPETLEHAKQALLNLCRSSRSRTIRSGMIAGDGEVGPLYVHHLNEFAAREWDPTRGSQRSDSLLRAINRLREIPGNLRVS